MDVIHIILGKANPERMNGVNKVVDQLAAQQTLAGQQVEVWGLASNPVHDYPKRNYTTRLFRKNKNTFVLPSGLRKAIQNLEGKPVFHLHGGFVPAMRSAAQQITVAGLRYVFTPHGSYNLIAMQKSRWQKQLYLRFFEKRLLQKAHRIHALGQSELDGLQTFFPNQKSVLIPYGYEGAQENSSAVSRHDFTAAFCGRLDVYTKGLRELIEGFALFHCTHTDAKLWIIGDSAEKPALMKHAAALLPPDAVIFWGSKFGSEKLSLLRQCCVFVAPSRNEGLPTAVLEAASLGIPCLVTEATNTGAAIRKYGAGKVIAETDAVLVAGGLKQMYNRWKNKTVYAEMQSGARQMVSEEYNWSTIVQRFQTLYQS